MLKIVKNYWFLLVIFVLVLVLFFPVLNTYFTGDDFFHFKVSQTDGSFISFMKLFGFYTFEKRGIAFYRPIFREATFNIFHSLFGLNHLPFRILQLAIHLVNINLVYVFTFKLIRSKYVAFFSTFFFGISAANVGSLYYLAGGIQAQGALMFTLFSLISFLNKKKILSFIFFLLAISSHEIVICLPFLLVGIEFLQRRKFVLKNYLNFAPYFVILLVYLYLNVFVIGFSANEAQYKPSLNPKTLVNTLSWYISWSLGLPEMFVDFLLPGFKLNPDLLKYWGSYFKYIFPAFFLSVAILFVLVLRIMKDILKDKKVCFLISWFILGILPVLLLPLHKKTYYLQVSLPALWTLIGYMSYRSAGSHPAGKYIKSLLIISLIVLNISSIKLAGKTYWAAQRGRAAEKLIKDVKSQYPTLPKGAGVFVKNDPNYPFINKEWGGTSKQAYFILNGSDALQLLYKDNSLKVYYEDIEIPKEILIKEFVAKLP